MQWLAVVLLIAGCETETPTVAPAPPPQPAIAAPRAVQRIATPALLPVPPIPPDVVPIATEPNDITHLAPGELLAAADQARADATGYVAWHASRAENIDVLTTLTGELNVAVTIMRAGRTDGHYRNPDIAVTRAALSRLRAFLAGKGD